MSRSSPEPAARRRHGLAGLVLALVAAAAPAAPGHPHTPAPAASAAVSRPAAAKAVVPPEAFEAATWAGLQREVAQRQRPALVVFSATWCSVCPEVVAGLSRDARRRQAGVPLWVVLTDVAPDEVDLAALSGSHLALADRLLAFDGPAAPIRYAVDPRWRGMVPQVAWLAPGQAPEFLAGAPASATLQRWLAAERRR